MNNDKRASVKRIAAFVAALSFLSVSNYGALNEIAADAASKKIQAEEVTVTATEAETSASTTPASTSAVTTTTQTTASTTTTTATTTESKKDFSFSIEVKGDGMSDDERNKAAEKLADSVNGNDDIKGKYKECKADKDKVYITYTAYKAEAPAVEKGITDLLADMTFNYIENNKYYSCTVSSTGKSMNAVMYYRMNTCNTVDDTVFAAGTYVDSDGSRYIKHGIELNENNFTMKNGYYLEVEKDAVLKVNGFVELSDDAIKIKRGQNTDKLFSVKKSVLTITFTKQDVSIKKWNENHELNESYTLDWTDIEYKGFNIHSHNGKYITINDQLINTNGSSDYSCSVKALLELLSTEENNELDYEDKKELKIAVTGVPPQIDASRTFIVGEDDEDLTDTVTFSIENNIINIPLLVKKGNTDYYLSRYRYDVNNVPNDYSGSFTLSDVYKKMSSGNYYLDSILYSCWGNAVKKMDVEYTPLKAGDALKRDELLSGFSNRRNDNVFCMKSAPIISVPIDESLGLDKKSFVLLNEKMKLAYSYVREDALEITLREKRKFLEFISLFDTGEANDPMDLCSIYFGDPFFIYFDETAPKIGNLTAAERYAEKDGWSNDRNSDGRGQYTFTFDVSDDDEAMERFEGMTDELKEKYLKINENPDLCSVSSVTVGGIVFEKPDGGWSSVSSISPASVPADSPFTAVLIPVKNDEGVFEGTFTARLTLAGSVDGFDDEVIVTAADNCGNDSAENKEKQAKIRVKIDTCAPTASSISINDLTDGIAGKSVLIHGRDLVVNAAVNDESLSNVSSGIVSAEINYADKKAYGNNVTFDVKNADIEAPVSITLTDRAGNTKTYYYTELTSSKVTDVQSRAAYIITDNTKPEKPAIVELAPPAYEEGDKKWYNSYQDMAFTVRDQGAALSEIRALSLRINNADVSTVDIRKELAKLDLTDAQITSLLADTGMYITFVPEKADNQQFIPYLCSDANGVRIPLSDAPLSLDKGKLKAEISVIDYAGNVSDRGLVRIFIDNNAPVVGGVFSSDDANYRKFGTFFNKQTVIRVPISDDSEGTPTSGWDKAVLKFATVSYPADKIENNCAYFTVPTAVIEETTKPISGRFDITVSDKVGNTTTFEGLASQEQITDAVFERIKPVIPETPAVTGDNRYVNDKGELWFSSDASVRYDVSDPDSGLASAKLERSHEDHDPDSVKEESYSQLAEMTVGDVFEMSTDTARDGKFTFTMTATDNAGNLERRTADVYKDVNAPYISGFDFEREHLYNEGNSDTLNIVRKMGESFGHFFLRDTVMTIYAKDDRGASAGIKAICFAFYDAKGTMIGESFVTDLHLEHGVYSCTVTIPEGFKGDIRAWAVDNVENTSEESSPDGIVIENYDRHEQTSNGKITMPSTDHRDTEGLPLYNRDITAELLVEDAYSGIRKIDLMTSDLDGTHSVEVNGKGDLEGGGWEITSKERNIATAIARSIGVTKDANGNYIRVAFTDNSGNITEQEVRFSIDKRKPVITVTGIEPSSEKKYYNTDKSAVVTITERNFRNPEVNGSSDGGFNADPNSVPGTDEYRHTKTFVFNTDGTYHLDIENTDLAGNEADRYTSGEFVIDKTAPVLNVEFVKSEGGAMTSSDSYVNGSVKANISVEELNFDSGSISIKVNGNDYKPAGWGGTGSTHTTELPASLFGEDGEYTVTISGSDLAGNSFRTYTRSFVIDTEKPSVEITGFSAANKGDVAPIINISDKNLDEHEIALYRNGVLCPMTFDRDNNIYKFDVGGGKYLTGTLTTVTLDSGSGRRFVFDNFPAEECFDGSYRIEASAKDMAANGYSIDREFSVNRFGSVFTVDDIESINGKYLAQARDIVIRERNVDLHDPKEDIIVIVDKGSSTVKLDAGRYSVSDAAPLKDGSGYEYVYTVFADNFNQDVDYRLSIQSVDEAGNKNVSTGRGAEFSFNIDTHDPEFKCDDLIDSAEFRESGKTFKLNVNETLQSIKVTTGDGEVLLDLEGEELAEYDSSFTFTIPAMNKSRSVTVELVDLAGRKTIKTFKDILITENVALFLLHKPWVKVAGGSALGGAGVLGGLAVFLKKKKKKKLF